MIPIMNLNNNNLIHKNLCFELTIQDTEFSSFIPQITVGFPVVRVIYINSDFQCRPIASFYHPEKYFLGVVLSCVCDFVLFFCLFLQ